MKILNKPPTMPKVRFAPGNLCKTLRGDRILSRMISAALAFLPVAPDTGCKIRLASPRRARRAHSRGVLQRFSGCFGKKQEFHSAETPWFVKEITGLVRA